MSLVPLSSSERIRIGDAVYERLRDAIFTGTLPPGSKLSIPALAESLGVSRSPVREAVVRLTQERFAREEPRRGAVVARVDLPELVRLYEVREVLEGLAARLAVLHGSEAFFAELTRTHREHEQAVTAGDTTRHMELDMRFHQLSRSAADNPELLRLLDDIQGRVRLAMLTTTVTSGPSLAVEDHRLILEALVARDAELAEQRARAHIARLRQALHAQGVSRSEDTPGVEGTSGAGDTRYLRPSGGLPRRRRAVRRGPGRSPPGGVITAVTGSARGASAGLREAATTDRTYGVNRVRERLTR